MTEVKRRPKGDGTVFQGQDGRWIGRLTYADRDTGFTKRAQVSDVTQKKAAAKLRDLRKKLEEGRKTTGGAVTFGDYADGWRTSTLAASDRKPSTKALYAGLTGTHIIPSTLGKTQCTQVAPTTVERFVKDLRARGLSESTVRQIYTVARAIAETAVRDGKMSVNPFAQVSRPKVAKTEAAFLTATEVDKLLAAAAGSRYKPVFDFIMATALRRGEALALRWTDVNLNDAPKERPRMPAHSARIMGTLTRIDGDLVVGPPKTKTSVRTIRLSGDALDVLKAMKVRQATERLAAGSKWSDTGYVFTTEFGEPCDPRNALRALTTAAKSAGLADIGVHTLRHSAATIMLNGGVPIAVVSKLLGHSSIQITVDTYGHEDEDASRDAFAALADARSKARAQAARV